MVPKIEVALAERLKEAAATEARQVGTSKRSTLIAGQRVAMNKSELQNRRRQAWAEAKVAVRAYARDPSTRNAERVTYCWKAIRKLERGLDTPRRTST
ncbi:MAG: hypothetical protein AAF942_12210 [Pseudomonadota bacterium]